MKNLILIICLGLLLAACGSKSSIEIKDDEISGEINAASKYKDKDFSIKGTFTAKIYKR